MVGSTGGQSSGTRRRRGWNALIIIVASGFVVVSAGRVAGGTPNGPVRDSDGDRLPDSVETNTGVYRGTNNAGTDPRRADTDGDAISDGDEILGTLAALDLPSLGANPLRPTIFVETDWYESGQACQKHYDLRPSYAQVSRIRDAFAQAPVRNPDGSSGIDLIIDYGQGGVFAGGNLIRGNGVIPGDFSKHFTEAKQANFTANRGGYFHYALMAAKYTLVPTSSGIGEFPGDDLIVALPPCLSISGDVAPHDEEIANTLMHELGHNLNLGHGGGDRVNWKPNYNSIMNYRYQGRGIDITCDAVGDRILSFSPGTRPTLDEASLDEHAGVCGDRASPIDWNGDGALTSAVAVDLNFNGQLDRYGDFNDWAHLEYGHLSGSDGTDHAWTVDKGRSSR